MVPRPHPEGYESSQHGAGDGGKASSHHCMDFREGHICQVRTDEQRCLCLKKGKIVTDQEGIIPCQSAPPMWEWAHQMHALPASVQTPVQLCPCWPRLHLFLYHVVKYCRQLMFIYFVYQAHALTGES